MAKYSVDATDLVSIADAIRAKAGTTDPLVFPDGFEEAIAAISAGGGASDGLKYAYGTFTPTSNMQLSSIVSSTYDSAYEIEHGLGEEPDAYMIMADSFVSGNATGIPGRFGFLGVSNHPSWNSYVKYMAATKSQYSDSSYTVSKNNGEYRSRLKDSRVIRVVGTHASTSTECFLKGGSKYHWLVLKKTE